MLSNSLDCVQSTLSGSGILLAAKLLDQGIDGPIAMILLATFRGRKTFFATVVLTTPNMRENKNIDTQKSLSTPDNVHNPIISI